METRNYNNVILGVGTLKYTAKTDADWNDYVGCQVVFSGTSGHVSKEVMHRPTGNNAALVCLGDNSEIFQLHIDQLYGIWIRCKGDRNEDFSEWNHLIVIQ